MKSIGQFISALRKANGMTQKELADKLCVSDKAISRWERDECAPDITLIPVIAEIFNVTADEILRGERIIKNEDTSKNNAKVEKQVEFLLNRTQSNFSVKSIISVGVCALGLIAAMICNTVVGNAQLGFLIACMFYLVSAICETVFVTFAVSIIKNSEIDDEKLSNAKNGIYRIMKFTYGAIVIFFIATLPLAVFSVNETLIIDPISWFIKSGIYIALAIAISAAVVIITSLIFIKKQDATTNTEQKKRLNTKRKRLIVYLLVLITVLAVTFGAQMMFSSMTSVYDFTDGKVFTNIDDYVEFMETPIDDSGDVYVWNLTRPDENDDSIEIVVREVHQRNFDVVTEESHFDENGNGTFKVYTHEDIKNGFRVLDSINICFVVGYFIEIAVIGIIYYFKEKNIK